MQINIISNALREQFRSKCQGCVEANEFTTVGGFTERVLTGESLRDEFSYRESREKSGTDYARRSDRVDEEKNGRKTRVFSAFEFDRATISLWNSRAIERETGSDEGRRYNFFEISSIAPADAHAAYYRVIT